MNTKAILTACTLGAVIGAASYLMHSPAIPVPTATAEDDDTAMRAYRADQDAMYWTRYAARANVAQYFKLSCRVLHGEYYRPDEAGNCSAGVNCASCVTHKGVAHNAVIHDNAPRKVKAIGPDYDAMMRQDKLVFQMSAARRAEIEAGRQAYDHSVRCSRLTWRADVQCTK